MIREKWAFHVRKWVCVARHWSKWSNLFIVNFFYKKSEFRCERCGVRMFVARSRSIHLFDDLLMLFFFALLLLWSSTYPNRNLSGEIQCKRFGAVTTTRIWHVQISRWLYWCNRWIVPLNAHRTHRMFVCCSHSCLLVATSTSIKLNINVVNAT